MTIHTTSDAWALAYADTDTALGDYPTVTQQLAQSVAAALTRGGVAPPAAVDLVTEANTRATADTALGSRATALEADVGRLKGSWTSVSTSTSYSQLGLLSGAVITGMQQTIPNVPAGHQAEVELAIPKLVIPVSTSAQVILQDATNSASPIVLDAAELTAGNASTWFGVPVRLSGVIAASGSDQPNRVIRAWFVQTTNTNSASVNAAAGAPIRQRYRIR